MSYVFRTVINWYCHVLGVFFWRKTKFGCTFGWNRLFSFHLWSEKNIRQGFTLYACITKQFCLCGGGLFYKIKIFRVWVYIKIIIWGQTIHLPSTIFTGFNLTTFYNRIGGYSYTLVIRRTKMTTNYGAAGFYCILSVCACYISINQLWNEMLIGKDTSNYEHRTDCCKSWSFLKLPGITTLNTNTVTQRLHIFLTEHSYIIGTSKNSL